MISPDERRADPVNPYGCHVAQYVSVFEGFKAGSLCALPAALVLLVLLLPTNVESFLRSQQRKIFCDPAFEHACRSLHIKTSQ